MLEPAYREYEPLIYKANIYRDREEDKWEVQKVVNY